MATPEQKAFCVLQFVTHESVSVQQVFRRQFNSEDKVFVSPQPVSIPDLKKRITEAVGAITPDSLSRVWQELDYRLDACRVTKGAYIEHL